MWNGTLQDCAVLVFYIHHIFFSQRGSHRIRKSAVTILPGRSKPEIPGKDLILFSSERMLQDTNWWISSSCLKPTVMSITSICVGREKYWKSQKVKTQQSRELSLLDKLGKWPLVELCLSLRKDKLHLEMNPFIEHKDQTARLPFHLGINQCRAFFFLFFFF